MIAVGTGLLNAAFVHVGVNLAGFDYLMVQIVTTAVLFVANFLLNYSVWTFPGPGRT